MKKTDNSGIFQVPTAQISPVNKNIGISYILGSI